LVGLEPRRGRQPVPVVTRPSRRCQTPVRWGFVGEGERGRVEACLPEVGGQAAKADLSADPVGGVAAEGRRSKSMVLRLRKWRSTWAAPWGVRATERDETRSEVGQLGPRDYRPDVSGFRATHLRQALDGI
jgi:hypothetical protein